jgi:NADH-quinone oxidoreductase subunit F
MVHGDARPQDGELLKSVADQIAGRTICPFGEACAWPTQSFVLKFAGEFAGYAEIGKQPKAADHVQIV